MGERGQPPVHLIHNGDLDVVLDRGQEGIETGEISCRVEDTGVVVLSLGVDGGEHDAVHYAKGIGVEPLELIGQALEARRERQAG
jgi:hypothetical protein